MRLGRFIDQWEREQAVARRHGWRSHTYRVVPVGGRWAVEWQRFDCGGKCVYWERLPRRFAEEWQARHWMHVELEGGEHD